HREVQAMPALRPNPRIPPAFERWYDSTLLTIALLIFFWPVGVYALVKNRNLGAFGKVFIGGGIRFCWMMLGGLAAFGGYYRYTHPDFVQKYLPNKPKADSTFVAVSDPAKDTTNPATTDENQ